MVHQTTNAELLSTVIPVPLAQSPCCQGGRREREEEDDSMPVPVVGGHSTLAPHPKSPLCCAGRETTKLLLKAAAHRVPLT